MAIDGAKFRKPVVPGDRLDLEVEVVRHKGAIWKTRGVATVDGAVVAEGEFLATVVDKDAQVASRPSHHGHRHSRRRSCIRDGRGGAVRGHRPPGEDWRGDDASARTRSSRGAPRIGERNRVFQFASVGAAPQDLKYAGEDTRAGDRGREPDPRVHHPAHRHRRGRRRHPHRATAISSWPTATWRTTARSGNGCVLANARDARRARRGGGPRHPRRPRGGAPVHPHRPARLHRRRRDGGDGRAAVLHRPGRPGRAGGLNTVGPRAARLHRGADRRGSRRRTGSSSARKLGLDEALARLRRRSSAATRRSSTCSTSSASSKRGLTR